MATVKKQKATHLPQDIITEILSRLPVKTLTSHLRHSALNPSLLLIRIPRLCDDSYNFIALLLRDEATTALERVHVPFMEDGDLLSIGACCYGIFCVEFPFSCCISKLALWNPATRQFREIPKPKYNYCPLEQHLGKLGFGLGFDSEIEDYTLVRIVHFEEDDEVYDEEVPNLKVEVYKGSEGYWREIEDCVLPCGYYGDSVSAKGVLYWMVSGLGEFAGRKFIVAFDLGGENKVFRRITMPSCKDYEGEIYMNLIVFQELLAVFVECAENCFELWAMNECSSGGGESWSKLFRIGPIARIAKPLEIWKDCKVIMKDWKPNDSCLFLCELGSQEIKNLIPTNEVHHWYYALTYVESLVSLGGSSSVT